MNIPRPSNPIQYGAVAVIVLLFISGGVVVLNESPRERAGEGVPNQWTPSNEPIGESTDTPSPPPDAEERLNSENGTTAVQISDGVTLIKAYRYEYTVSKANGLNGTVHVETRDTNPDGSVILNVEYKFNQESQMESNTAVGNSVTALLGDVENGTARLAVADAFSIPYLNNKTRIRPYADVGDTWNASDGITAEAIRRDTVGGIDCLHIRFTRGDEVLSEMCYSPEKQLVTQRITYENGTEIRRVTLSATR